MERNSWGASGVHRLNERVKQVFVPYRREHDTFRTARVTEWHNDVVNYLKPRPLHVYLFLGDFTVIILDASPQVNLSLDVKNVQIVPA